MSHLTPTAVVVSTHFDLSMADIQGWSATDLCDLPALVVPSEQGHVCWVSSFQQHEQREGFKAVVASVHKVTHEDVVCAGYLATSGK